MKRTALTIALILIMSLASTAPALAASNRPQAYLALGDSLAFGFDPLVVNSGNAGNPDNFIDIGVNDLGVLVDECGGTDTPTEINCILSGLPAMLATLSANLDTIYGHIRNPDGYNHKLVALTYFSLDYSDPLITNAVAQVNQVIADRSQPPL